MGKKAIIKSNECERSYISQVHLKKFKYHIYINKKRVVKLTKMRGQVVEGGGSGEFRLSVESWYAVDLIEIYQYPRP